MTILVGLTVVALVVAFFYGIMTLVSYITKIYDTFYLVLLTILSTATLTLILTVAHLVGNFVMNIFLK